MVNAPRKLHPPKKWKTFKKLCNFSCLSVVYVAQMRARRAFSRKFTFRRNKIETSGEKVCENNLREFKHKNSNFKRHKIPQFSPLDLSNVLIIGLLLIGMTKTLSFVVAKPERKRTKFPSREHATSWKRLWAEQRQTKGKLLDLWSGIRSFELLAWEAYWWGMRDCWKSWSFEKLHRLFNSLWLSKEKKFSC